MSDADAGAGGDPRTAYERLYSEFAAEVWAVAYARRCDADAARDVMQEAFLRLWRLIHSGTPPESPRGWLVRVARNLADDRSRSSFQRHGTRPPEDLRGLADAGRPPADTMARQATFAIVREELRSLPADDRELLTFRYALEYDIPRIARLFGISVGAVHMRLTRARQRLAERLARRDIAESP